jgi:undecaprenyl diphosphate synthase
MIKHLACIMDGNRRWAQQRGLPSQFGHKEGMDAVERTAAFCLKHAIPYLTLYTFSIENLKRSLEEKQYIFELLIGHFKNYGAQKFIEKNIRIQFIGDHALFPDQLREIFTAFEEQTAACSALTIYFLFCYGGRQEIVSAAHRIAKAVQQKEITPEDINEHTFAQYLWLPATVPDPELVIRTGGQHRLSNFLIYQAAYSELYFTDTLWPDIDEKELTNALAYVHSCQRNFGL